MFFDAFARTMLVLSQRVSCRKKAKACRGLPTPCRPLATACRSLFDLRSRRDATYTYKDPATSMVSIVPWSWAKEPGCRILMFMSPRVHASKYKASTQNQKYSSRYANPYIICIPALWTLSRLGAWLKRPHRLVPRPNVRGDTRRHVPWDPYIYYRIYYMLYPRNHIPYTPYYILCMYHVRIPTMLYLVFTLRSGAGFGDAAATSLTALTLQRQQMWKARSRRRAP